MYNAVCFFPLLSFCLIFTMSRETTSSCLSNFDQVREPDTSLLRALVHSDFLTELNNQHIFWINITSGTALYVLR